MGKAMCPNRACKKLFLLPETHVGRKVRCKACGTVFVATPLGDGATASQLDDPGVLTVVARQVGVQAVSPGGRPEAFATAGVLAPSDPQAAPPPGRRTAWLLLAVAALVLPVAAAGGFVAYKSWAGGGRGELYGGIEIGSKGVKYVLVELYPDERYGHNFRTLAKDSTNTNIVSGMKESGHFDAEGVKETAGVVRAYCARLAKEKLPPARIFVVGSGGLFGPLASRDDAARAGLTEENQHALAAAVAQAAGQKVDFLDVEQEIRLQVEGCVRSRHLDSALYVDVGGGGTRGGYREPGSDIVRKVSTLGVRDFRDLVKAHAARPGDFAGLADRLAPAELFEPLRKQVERNEGLRAPRHVYLGGGTVWVMATCLHAKERDTASQAYIKLAATDVGAFSQLVHRNPDFLKTFKPPAGLKETSRKEIEEDVKRMQKTFSPEELIAGAKVLEALAAELEFRKKDELWFCRYSDNAALFGYIAEKSPFQK